MLCVPPYIVICGARSLPAVPPLLQRSVPSIQSVAVGVVLAVLAPAKVGAAEPLSWSKAQLVQVAELSETRLPLASKK